MYQIINIMYNNIINKYFQKVITVIIFFCLLIQYLVKYNLNAN